MSFLPESIIGRKGVKEMERGKRIGVLIHLTHTHACAHTRVHTHKRNPRTILCPDTWPWGPTSPDSVTTRLSSPLV